MDGGGRCDVANLAIRSWIDIVSNNTKEQIKTESSVIQITVL